MPLVLADRVNETTTTTSTGTITLAGAVSGYQSFAVIGNGNTTYYTIVHQTANEWEVGIGTYTSSGTTLSRDTVLASSNSGSLVNFSAGTKFVFCDYPAGRAVYLDTATNVTIPGLTLSGGTANGVLYLNGSKVATSGTALTFDGTAVGIGQASGTSSGFSTAPNLLVYGATNANILVAGDSSGVGITSARYANTTGGGILRVGKYRGTYASPSAAQTGDTAGDVRFEVWGGSNLRRVATIAGTVETFTSDTDISGYLAFNTTSSGSTTPTEKMRLTAAGNLGIGVTSPGYKLHVENYMGLGTQASPGAGSGINMIPSSTLTNWFVGTNFTVSGAFEIIPSTTGGGSTFTTPAFLINSSGNLGIGTSSPASKLHVSNTAAATRITITDDVASGRSGYIESNFSDALVIGTTSGVRGIRFSPDNTPRMLLDVPGNLGLGVTPSAWGGGYKSLDILAYGSVAVAGGTFQMLTNAFYNGTNYIYKNTAAASDYYQNAGTHVWRNAASGTAGNAISFTQAMTLTAAGELLVGGTTALASAANRGNVTINGGSGGSSILALGTANSLRGYILHTGTNMQVFNGSNATLAFGTNNTERMRITAIGNIVAGASAALATTATDGFLYVPTCAGTPTGTPTAITGMAPIVVNTTNNKLYFYSGGAWRDAGP